jgi:hypothetical protein
MYADHIITEINVMIKGCVHNVRQAQNNSFKLKRIPKCVLCSVNYTVDELMLLFPYDPSQVFYFTQASVGWGQADPNRTRSPCTGNRPLEIEHKIITNLEEHLVVKILMISICCC